jgi:hypothetical protein
MFNGKNKIEQCNFMFEIGIVMTESDREIFFCDHKERYYQFPFAIHERRFNKIFKNNLVPLISFLILFNPVPSHSFAIE